MGTDRLAAKLGTLLRYVAALAIASTACAAVSYGVVRYLLRDVEVYARPDQTALREATELRTISRDLAELTGDFMERAADNPESQAFRKWLEREFQPRLDALRQRLIDGPEYYDSTRPLLEAADKLNGSATDPQDATRRERAVRSVLKALLEAERRVSNLRVNPNQLPPPVPAPELDTNRGQDARTPESTRAR